MSCTGEQPTLRGTTSLIKEPFRASASRDIKSRRRATRGPLFKQQKLRVSLWMELGEMKKTASKPKLQRISTILPLEGLDYLFSDHL